MELTGAYLVPLPRAAVWAALNNVELLQAIIPRCESLMRLSATEIAAVVTVRIGPFKTCFKGLITLSEVDPPHGYRMRGEGQGGIAGFAAGGAKVRLTETDGGTLLAYDIEAAVGGKLSRFGTALIDSAARRWAYAFLDRFTQHAAAAAGIRIPSDSPQISS